MNDELNQEKWCPSCRMRYRLGAPGLRDFNELVLNGSTFGYLLAAAREFDETVEELTPGEFFTAVDFLDWIKPSLKEEPGKPFRSEKVAG